MKIETMFNKLIDDSRNGGDWETSMANIVDWANALQAENARLRSKLDRIYEVLDVTVEDDGSCINVVEYWRKCWAGWQELAQFKNETASLHTEIARLHTEIAALRGEATFWRDQYLKAEAAKDGNDA